MYDTIPFLSSLSKLWRADRVKYFSNTGKNEKRTQDYTDFENKINLFPIMGLKATCTFPEALLPSTFIGLVEKDA